MCGFGVRGALVCFFRAIKLRIALKLTASNSIKRSLIYLRMEPLGKGDLALIEGLTARPELNGRLVQANGIQCTRLSDSEYIPEKRNTKNAWDCFINSGRTKLAALDYKKFAETNGLDLYVPIKFKNPNTGTYYFKILNDKMRFVVCPVDAEDLGDDEWR